MKKLLFLVSAAVAAAGSLSAAWTYDVTEGTISDGVWKFGATVKNGTTELTVNAVQVVPGEVSPLDFSQPVTDADGASYTIVELNTQFGGSVDQWGNLPKAKAESAFVGELTIPTAGLKVIGVSAFYNCTNATGTITLGQDLTTIGSAAFCKCTKLTSVEPVVPDSVTSIGMLSFNQVNIPKNIRLENVSTLSHSVFYGSAIESVYFGPGLKSIGGSINTGAFGNCTSLTNVSFGAGITNAAFTGTHQFKNCPNIVSDLDLSGFSKLYCDYVVFESSPNIKKIKIGAGIEQISSAFFSKLPGLKEITFLGKPPKTFSTPLYAGLGNSQFVTTLVPVAYSNEWSVYAANGVINETDSTFSSKYFSEEVMPARPLLFSDVGGGGELGDAIFDEDLGVLTMPGGWVFNASTIGVNLTVGSCITAPAEVSPLDFSVRITNKKGKEHRVSVLDTKFGSVSYSTPNNVPTFVFTPNLGAHKVGKLTFPTNGLSTISANAFTDCQFLTGPLVLPDGLLAVGDAAFANCTSLTEIVNYLPDSVTGVSRWAFVGVPAAGSLRLRSIASLGELAFMSTGIQSVYFGPLFKGFSSYNWNVGPFRHATSLTNLTFDAGIQGAKWTSQHVFLDCQNIEGVVDLSGFTEITTDWGMISGGGKIIEVVFGENLSNLHGSVFQGMSSLTNVIFKGVPPKTFTGTYLNGLSSTKQITTQVSWAKCKETNASGLSWFDYANNGVIKRKGSTWIASKVAGGIDLKYRPLVAPDAVYGLMLLIR